MSNRSRYLFVSLSSLSMFLLVVSTASAQDIRRYGDQSGGSNDSGGGGGGQRQMTYPGQPMPQQDQQGGTQQSEGKQGNEEEGEQEDVGSYAISIHEPGDRFTDEEDETQSDQPDIFDRPDNKIYKGIIPGDRNEVDHLSTTGNSETSRTSGNRLTWIGFQPKDSKTRVFVQFDESPRYSVSRQDDGKTLVLSFENARVTAGNFRRHVDTRFFDRAVRRIDTNVVDNDKVEMRITLNEAKTPSIETDDNFLYVDFNFDKPDNDESGE